MTADFDAAAPSMPRSSYVYRLSDVRERPDHEDPGRDDGPPTDPAEPRPQRARAPREGRPGILIGTVHVEERGRDQEHRHERGEERAGSLESDDDRHRADDGSEGVGRRRRREADREGLSKTDGVVLELTSLDLREMSFVGCFRHPASLTQTCLIRVYSSIE
jgi:hypothetical protein